MKALFTAALAALLLSSCAGKTETEALNTETEAPAAITDIIATWEIEKVVANDTLSVIPAEIDPEVTQTITFTDSTYSVTTNCNTLGGNYTLAGDSITLSAPFSTRMACDNADVETLMAMVLPEVNVISQEGDSVIILTAPTAAYIRLKK